MGCGFGKDYGRTVDSHIRDKNLARASLKSGLTKTLSGPQSILHELIHFKLLREKGKK